MYTTKHDSVCYVIVCTFLEVLQHSKECFIISPNVNGAKQEAMRNATSVSPGKKHNVKAYARKSASQAQ